MASKKASRPRVLLVNRCIVMNEKGKFLLIQRSPNGQWAAGFWEFPGGKLDEGQNIFQTLEREVMEETGLLVKYTSRIAFVDSIMITSGPYVGLPYIVIIGIGKLTGGKVSLSDEHQAYKWVSARQALKMHIKPEVREAILVLKQYLN